MIAHLPPFLRHIDDRDVSDEIESELGRPISTIPTTMIAWSDVADEYVMHIVWAIKGQGDGRARLGWFIIDQTDPAGEALVKQHVDLTEYMKEHNS